MKPSCNSMATQKLSDCWRSLCDYRLQKECDTTITLYDEKTAAEPMFSHHTKGSISLPLWKLLAAVGVVTAFCALLHGLCSLFSD